jgi:hypothetical protein
VNPVEASHPVDCGIDYPFSESGTSGFLQRRIGLLFRENERASTAPRKLSNPSTVLQPVWCGYVFINDLALNSTDADEMNLLNYAPNATVRIGSMETHRVNCCIYTHEFALQLVEPRLVAFPNFAPNVTAQAVNPSYPQEIFVMPEMNHIEFAYNADFGVALRTRPSEPTPVEKLRAAYVFNDSANVELYVKDNRLTDILIQAVNPIEKKFGAGRKRTLTLVEDDEGSRTLFCFMTFSGSLDEAQKALDSFDREWWLKYARQFGTKLNFDFELV